VKNDAFFSSAEWQSAYLLPEGAQRR